MTSPRRAPARCCRDDEVVFAGDSLTREQFLLSQLLLSGAASHDVVDIIYDRYRTINTDNDDAITREEFLAHVHNRHEHRAPTPAHVKLARKLSARLHV